jgi:hypothetical protein
MPKDRPQSTFIIGIDPDKEASGVAVLNRVSGQFTELKKLNFPKLIKLIVSYKPDDVVFVVEAGWKNKSTWHYPPNVHTWNGKAAWMHGAKIGKDVGRNHDVGEQLVTCLTEWGFQVIEPRPDNAKWDADFFNLQTGHTGKSNQEVRDAGKLAWLYK